MNPMLMLELYKELRDARATFIRDARAKGHTWQEIAEASGMSRAMVIRLTASGDHQSSR